MRNIWYAFIAANFAAIWNWHLWRQGVRAIASRLPHGVVSSVGVMLGLLAVAFVSKPFQPNASSIPLLLAPVGATAVLVFVYPESPLSQPWPVIGGSFISAMVGITMAWLIPAPAIAAACAVAGAIMAMSFARCLHPPGGAAALLAVVGGPTLKTAGYWLAINPISINAVTIVIVAVIWRRITFHLRRSACD